MKNLSFSQIVNMIVLTFSLYFGTAIFLSSTANKGDSSDPLYDMIKDLFTFNNFMMCVIASIIIIILVNILNLLNSILNELKNLNRDKEDTSDE